MVESFRNGWTASDYRWLRIAFGGYLFVHFAQLIPWGAEVFSDQGMIAQATDSPLLHLFPNIFMLADSPAFVTALLASAAGAALMFASGRHDRWAALWMWYVLACLFGRNPMIQNPSLPYVGWMLLAHCFVPPLPRDPLAQREWRMPPELFLAAWIVLSLAYSYSGWTKLLSPSWENGEMLGYVLQNPLARDHALREWILALPPWMLQTVTLGILWVELLFAPIALIPRLRPWVWGAMLAVQFGFAFLLNFADLTAAMLIFHAFTFDPAWVRASSNQPQTSSPACRKAAGSWRYRST